MVIDAEGRFRYVSPRHAHDSRLRAGRRARAPVTDFLVLDQHNDFDEVFAAVVDTPGVHRRFGLNLRARRR